MEPNKVPTSELDLRLTNFRREMDKAHVGWKLCCITDEVGKYYLTGTVTSGFLMIHREDYAVLWVRSGYERATTESNFGDIRTMSGFSDVSAALAPLPDTLYLDMSFTTMEWYGRFSKQLSFKNVLPADGVMSKVRSIKSEYELGFLRQAGKTLDRLLREAVPSLLQEGMSEVDLGAELYALLLKNGHHGIMRFTGTNYLGQVSFGESTLYHTAFNGVAGIIGICPACPVLGSSKVLLRPGDIVFVDFCFGVEGYNVDKTFLISYKGSVPEHALAAHRHCIDLENKAASMLRPGVKPSEIYSEILSSVRPEFKDCFMGLPGRNVSFIGHSVGLYVDEKPAIAKGFDDPLEVGMTIALEPKIAVLGVGLVGSENTYLVTEHGGVSLTGAPMDIEVY